ncbi:MAG TPA: Clp protease N-terminal domain-containing protein [Bryobacteraceae bacterium]|nr:Clp protease N-terminal domain-containing protein [Bryobacteraceae bacterium]
MFDRFTERARRVIFFARYEASTFSSPFIQSEHVLLGLLREDKSISAKLELSMDKVEAIRKEIKSGPHPIPASIDLPLSRECRQAIAYAAEESAKLHAANIDSEHLLLGLLRINNGSAAELLRPYGIRYATVRKIVAAGAARSSASRERPIECSSAWHDEALAEATAPSLLPAIASLRQLVDGAVEHLSAYSDAYGDQRLKRKPWTRKEALGHLIDCAAAHQQWFARVLTDAKLVALSTPQDEWVTAQQYATFSWPDTVDLWVSLNRLLIHVLAQFPETKLNTPCRIGIADPIPLSDLIARYIAHCEDIVGQILAQL